MPDTKLRSMKATEILKRDHERVKKLFKDLEAQADRGASLKEELFAEIRAELTIHAEVEEKIFYPAIESLDDFHDARSRIEEAYEEHRIVKTLLDEISKLDVSDEKFNARVKVLRENVEHHAGEEEKEIFPLFRKLEKNVQQEVSEDLRIRKEELLDTRGSE